MGTLGTAHATHTCSVSGVRLVWHDHVSRRRFDMRPYANSFQIRTRARTNPKQNKTKAGTVGYGLVKVSLAWVLFIYAHVLCRPNVPYPLLVTCTVFCLPTLTHTYSRRITHTHRTPPASSSSPLERPLINAACLGIKG